MFQLFKRLFATEKAVTREDLTALIEALLSIDPEDLRMVYSGKNALLYCVPQFSSVLIHNAKVKLMTEMLVSNTKIPFNLGNSMPEIPLCQFFMHDGCFLQDSRKVIREFVTVTIAFVEAYDQSLRNSESEGLENLHQRYNYKQAELLITSVKALMFSISQVETI